VQGRASKLGIGKTAKKVSSWIPREGFKEKIGEIHATYHGAF